MVSLEDDLEQLLEADGALEGTTTPTSTATLASSPTFSPSKASSSDGISEVGALSPRSARASAKAKAKAALLPPCLCCGAPRKKGSRFCADVHHPVYENM
eukprot:15094200-Alexandrium_andersonii.AAC.1